MHPYHIKEFADERVATRLRDGREHRLVAAALASQQSEGPAVRRGGPRFRIPLLNWELHMHPVRPARAGH